MDKLQRMKELIEVLNKASSLYYNGKDSVLSDREWDNVYDELQQLEKETNTVLSNSPTTFVGYTVSSKWDKITHEYPALSLNKIKDRKELLRWLGNQNGVLSWKCDGLTVIMTYDDGKLTSFCSRGDGIVGERLDANAPFIHGVPMQIPYKGHLVVRGEAMVSRESFRKINDLIPNEEDKFKNARNLASGTIRNLDSKVVAERNVEVKAFELVYADDISTMDLYSKNLEFLSTLGFDVVRYLEVDKHNLLEAISEFEKMIECNEFGTDGLVLAYDDIKYSKSLGTTSKFPLGSMAFKWNDDTYETTVTGVEWSPSRTGALNPVLLFDTVNINGSDVSRASIHNINIMKELELGVGDTVEVYLANMIIPQIAENQTRSNTIEIPQICPVCHAQTEIKVSEDGLTEVLYCTNENCPAKLLGKLKLFCSKESMNIEGLSEATLETFINKGYLHNAADIYNLKDYAKEIMKLDGFGKRSVDKLLAAIEDSRQTTLDKFIRSLGIDLIGKSGSKDLAKFCNGDIKTFNQHIVNHTDFSAKIDGFGDKMNKSIHDWFKNVDNRVLYKVISKEISFKENKKETNGNNTEYKDLSGEIYVITGSLNHFKSRDELKALLESLGAKVSGSVSAKTTVLVCNEDSNSSKSKKAKELNIPIWTEDDLLNYIKI